MKFDIKRNSLLNEGILDIILLNNIKIVKFLLIFKKKLNFFLMREKKFHHSKSNSLHFYSHHSLFLKY